MKIKFYLTLFIAAINIYLKGQTCQFTPIGNGVFVGNPYVEATDIAGIERILSRSILMESLCSDIYQNRCTDYNNAVNMLADLNATFIGNVTDYYKAEWDWAAIDVDRTTDPFFTTVKPEMAAYKKVVEDINLAYDRKSLRRPVINAFIPETINPKIEGAGTAYSGIPIEKVKIPKSVISYFVDQMSQIEKDYYLNQPSFLPRDNLFFKFDRVTWRSKYLETDPVNDPKFSPDVTKIEGRMWLFLTIHQIVIHKSLRKMYSYQ
jgi:hypothetical protein